MQAHAYIKNHALSCNPQKSECAYKQSCPSQKGSSTRLSPSSAVGMGGGRGSLWLTGLLMTAFSADKTLHISEENLEFLIRLAFTGSLSTFWAHILNGAGWFREHIDAINSSAALGDRIKEQRGEGGGEMSSRGTAWNVCTIERGTDVVFVAGVFVRQGVCVKFA